jgi:hypothetical protein
MSEPIRLYDRDGNEVTRYSPTIAAMEVASGLLFVEPPVLTPDDTHHDLAAVPVRKRKPREKGDGGVL